jgi:hypothetical protein
MECCEYGTRQTHFTENQPVANFIKLFWHNLCHYWHIALSFICGYTGRGINYSKKCFMKLTIVLFIVLKVPK